MNKPKLIRDLTNDKWNYYIRKNFNNNLNNNKIINIGSIYINNGNIMIRYFIEIKDNIWYKSIKYYDKNDVFLKGILEKINLDIFL